MKTVTGLRLEVTVYTSPHIVHESLITAYVFLCTILEGIQVLLYLSQVFILQISDGIP